MRKIIIFLIILGGIFCAPLVLAAERIENFEVIIKINQDSSLEITEKIEFDFGPASAETGKAERHGIYRTIPIKYKTTAGNYNLKISDIFVTDENNQPVYKYNVSYPQDNIQIKIGDPEVSVFGRHIYLINYKIKKAVNYFEEYDEIFWNVTGNDWPVNIANARAIVYLPRPLDLETIKTACFGGIYGSSQPCDRINYSLNDQDLAEKITFSQADLKPRQGLTIVIGLPKGLIYQPAFAENILEIIKDNWIIFLPLIILAILAYLWFTRGKDPSGRGTIIAQFDAPDKLSPGQVGTLFDEKAQAKDVSAEIIYLAITGYLKITRQEKGKLFKLNDYVFEKLKEADDNLNSFQKILMSSIWQGKDSTSLSELKNKFYRDFDSIKKQIYESLVAGKYFVKCPQKVRLAYIILAFIFLFLSFFIGPLFGIIGWLSFIISTILIFIFSFIMPKKTHKGVLAKEHILGLREYLKIAEKERIKFHNAPEKNPQEFERLLPYAMVLGVEKEWAKQFADIYKNQSPNWYSDPSAPNFSALALTDRLSNFNTQANSSLSSRPSSAASGSSGFSSGGSSGRGFGGGGGGSW